MDEEIRNPAAGRHEDAHDAGDDPATPRGSAEGDAAGSADSDNSRAERYYGVKPGDPPDCGLRQSVAELAAEFAQVRADALAAGFKCGWGASEAFEDFDQAFQKCCALADSPASNGKGGGEG